MKSEQIKKVLLAEFSSSGTCTENVKSDERFQVTDYLVTFSDEAVNQAIARLTHSKGDPDDLIIAFSCTIFSNESEVGGSSVFIECHTPISTRSTKKEIHLSNDEKPEKAGKKSKAEKLEKKLATSIHNFIKKIQQDIVTKYNQKMDEERFAALFAEDGVTSNLPVTTHISFDGVAKIKNEQSQVADVFENKKTDCLEFRIDQSLMTKEKLEKILGIIFQEK